MSPGWLLSLQKYKGVCCTSVKHMTILPHGSVLPHKPKITQGVLGSKSYLLRVILALWPKSKMRGQTLKRDLVSVALVHKVWEQFWATNPSEFYLWFPTLGILGCLFYNFSGNLFSVLKKQWISSLYSNPVKAFFIFIIFFQLFLSSRLKSTFFVRWEICYFQNENLSLCIKWVQCRM